MKIADLEFFLLDAAGSGADSADRTLLVRLGTADGQFGWGEMRTSWRASELGLRRESLLSILAGQNVADVEELLEMHGLQPSALRAAVEMACWDAIARGAKQPLRRIWGGDYRPRVPLAVRLPLAAPDRAAELARDLAERGVHHQIITATGCLEDDVAVVDAVRESTGDRLKLRMDGAARFAADDARELCRRLERAGLQFLLDPLDTGLDGFAALVRQTTVPLAISTAIRGPADVLAIARIGTTAHIVIDLAVVGGLWPARKCAIVAAAANVPASLRGGDGLGVALAGMLQLAAATPNLGLGAHQCASYQLSEDVLRDRPTIVNGTMAVPQGPGLGVEVDRLRIEAYQVT